ncbi:MAG TPA: hypothetical protein VMY99_05565 [Nevskiaceae bacterium]|nr:hypothetical protein [Nevskiaceae bacterium]
MNQTSPESRTVPANPESAYVLGVVSRAHNAGRVKVESIKPGPDAAVHLLPNQGILGVATNVTEGVKQELLAIIYRSGGSDADFLGVVRTAVLGPRGKVERTGLLLTRFGSPSEQQIPGESRAKIVAAISQPGEVVSQMQDAWGPFWSLAIKAAQDGGLQLEYYPGTSQGPAPEIVTNQVADPAIAGIFWAPRSEEVRSA